MSASVATVNLNSLRRFLTSTGWKITALPNGIDLFHKSLDGGMVEIVLPQNSNKQGTAERIESAVATLSVIHDKKKDEIAKEIASVGYDTILSSLPTLKLDKGSLKLSVASAFISKIYRILASIAHSELHRGPYFDKLDPLAQTYAAECRFGHTFEGSFGFTVESPVGPNSDFLEDSETLSPPLERRTVRRFARGIRSIAAAAAEQSPNIIVESYSDGLNANACDEFASLLETPRLSKVNFKIIFSREWGHPPDLGPTPSFVLTSGATSEILKDAASKLRAVSSERDVTVVGKVIRLSSQQNPSDLFHITKTQDIVIEYVSDRFGKINVRASVDPESYLRAVDAHRQGLKVRIVGDLEIAKGSKRLIHTGPLAIQA